MMLYLQDAEGDFEQPDRQSGSTRHAYLINGAA
jgi:hypothetical protein